MCSIASIVKKQNIDTTYPLCIFKLKQIARRIKCDPIEVEKEVWKLLRKGKATHIIGSSYPETAILIRGKLEEDLFDLGDLVL